MLPKPAFLPWLLIPTCQEALHFSLSLFIPCIPPFSSVFVLLQAQLVQVLLRHQFAGGSSGSMLGSGLHLWILMSILTSPALSSKTKQIVSYFCMRHSKYARESFLQAKWSDSALSRQAKKSCAAVLQIPS